MHQRNIGVIEQQMCDNILQGKYVTNLIKYNDRLFQRLMIAQMDSLPCEIVLGSSRAMQITNEFATLHPFYNSAVFGGVLEDIMGVYNMYETHKAPIKRIIIGVDPWIFKEDKTLIESYTLEDDYKEMCHKIGSDSYVTNSLLGYVNQLSNISMLKSTMIGIVKQKIFPDRTLFKPTTDSLNIGETEYTDGAYSVSQQEREQSREKLLNIDVNHHLNHNFTILNQAKIDQFEKFIHYIKTQGKEVILVFAPYHPLVWEQVSTKDPMVIETYNHVTNFAAKNKIEVAGSYDPNIFDFDVIDFINGGHPKKQVFYKILNKK